MLQRPTCRKRCDKTTEKAVASSDRAHRVDRQRLRAENPVTGHQQGALFAERKRVNLCPAVARKVPTRGDAALVGIECGLEQIRKLGQIRLDDGYSLRKRCLERRARG